MRAFQRTSNHDRTTDQTFFIDKSFNPPPFSPQFGRRFFTVNVEDLSASVFKRCKSIRHKILSGAAQNFFGQYASLKVFGNQILSGDDSI